jgi:hypothetical protein
MSVRLSARNMLEPTGWIYMKFDIWVFFENLSRKWINLTRVTVTLHDNLCTFMKISCSVLRMRNIWDKSCRENQNTHFMFSNLFSENYAIYVEKCGRARQGTDDSVVWCMWFVCWMTKATCTYPECVILIAFPQQQWLCKHTSVLRYMYIAVLVNVCIL